MYCQVMIPLVFCLSLLHPQTTDIFINFFVYSVIIIRRYDESHIVVTVLLELGTHQFIQAFPGIFAYEFHLASRPLDDITTSIKNLKIIQRVIDASQIICTDKAIFLTLYNLFCIIAGYFFYFCRKTSLLFDIHIPILGIDLAPANLFKPPFQSFPLCIINTFIGYDMLPGCFAINLLRFLVHQDVYTVRKG